MDLERLMQSSQLELLQAMPVFGAIREDVLELLLGHARSASRRAGEYFFRENEQADSMFILESGCASVTKAWQDGECFLHRLHAGDCFGEMALMDMGPRSASVRADEDCVAIELATRNFMELFERDLEQFALIQMNIGREVCRRLRVADERVFQYAMRECQQGGSAPASDPPPHCQP